MFPSRKSGGKSNQLGMRDLQQEIGSLAERMAEMQTQLTTISRMTSEEYHTLQQSIRNLESQNGRLADENRRLIHHNEDLADGLAHRKVEIRNGLAARDMAIRRLRNSRRFIKDLLEERLDATSERSDITNEDVHAILADVLLRRSEEGSSNSTRTPQPKRGGRRAEEPLSPRSILESQQTQQAILPDAPERDAGHPERPTAPEPSAPLSVDEQGGWRIHQSKPPKTAQRLKGFPLPDSTEGLAKFLEKIERISQDDAMSLLESLQAFREHKDPGIRMHITGDLAFIYDPIFLESEVDSYVIDWGDAESNREIEEYLVNQAAPYFHMFVYPLKKQRWHYIGAHRWEVAKIWSVWPSLDAQSRGFVVDVIKRRADGELEGGVIEELLNKESYEQMCIKLSTDSGLAGKSEELRQLGYGSRTELKKDNQGERTKG